MCIACRFKTHIYFHQCRNDLRILMSCILCLSCLRVRDCEVSYRMSVNYHTFVGCLARLLEIRREINRATVQQNFCSSAISEKDGRLHLTKRYFQARSAISTFEKKGERDSSNVSQDLEDVLLKNCYKKIKKFQDEKLSKERDNHHTVQYPRRNSFLHFKARNYEIVEKLMKNSQLFETFLHKDQVNIGNSLESQETIEVVKKLRVEFLHALFEDAKRYCCGNLPGEIPGTVNQTGSEVWTSERAIRLTASKAKTFLFTPPYLYSDILKNYLWNFKDLGNSIGEKYGVTWENEAVKAYLQWACSQDKTVTLKQTGMWVNPAFPQLSCTPDGIIMSEISSPRLLEVKCPPFLEGGDVLQFEKYTVGEDPDRFYLGRNSNGTLYLKKTCKYWYQIQMSMGILNIEESDFVVWAHRGYFIERVKFDQNFWDKLKSRLLKLHAEIWVPEYFLQRVPRGLKPIVLQFRNSLVL